MTFTNSFLNWYVFIMENSDNIKKWKEKIKASVVHSLGIAIASMFPVSFLSLLDHNVRIALFPILNF